MHPRISIPSCAMTDLPMFTGVHISENTQAESLSKVLKKPLNGAPGLDLGVPEIAGRSKRSPGGSLPLSLDTTCELYATLCFLKQTRHTSTKIRIEI